MLRLSLVALVAALLVGCVHAQDWDGVWGDSCQDNQCFGGMMFMCSGQDVVNAMYSEIGFVYGEIDDDHVEGEWIEAGFSLENHGTFRWNSVDDDDDDLPGFAGKWSSRTNECLRRPWSARHLDTRDPDPALCAKAVANPKAPLVGTWASDSGEVISFCRWTNNFIVGTSSSNSTAEQDFYTGTLHYDDRVARMSYIDAVGEQRIALAVQVDSNGFLMYRWNVARSAEALDRFDEPGLHTVDVFSRIGSDDDDDDVIDQPCAAARAQRTRWEGTFTDPRHKEGLLNVCNTGDGEYQAVFSELGWISGTVQNDDDEDTMVGIWGQAGNDDDDFGTVRLQLDPMGLTYSAVYVSGDDRFTTVSDGVRLDTVPSPENCWITPLSEDVASVRGAWDYGSHGGDVFDICVTDDDTPFSEVSYQYNGNVQGYGRGFAARDLQSLRIRWTEKSAAGIAIYRLLDENTLLESLWALETDAADIDLRICDDLQLNYQYWGLHSVNKLLRVATNSNADRCGRNSRLADSSPSRSSYERISPPSDEGSTASKSQLSVLFIAAVAVAALCIVM